MSRITMILCNAFHPDIRVYKEAKYLVGQGHSVTILALDRKGEFLGSPEEVKDGIHIKRFSFRDDKIDNKLEASRLLYFLRYFVYLFWYFRFILQTRIYIKNNSCEYLHCHDMDGMAAGIFACRNTIPLVFDMHEEYEEQSAMRKKIKYFVRFAVTLMQNRCQKIIVVNECQTVHMTKRNRQKVILLPNYPDFSMFEGVCHQPSSLLRINYIGMVRGQLDLFRYLFEACKDFKVVSISIHGGGGGYPELKKMEQQYPNVSVTGPYDGIKDSARLYSNTDVMYICYDKLKIRQSQPVKFFEALYTCTPIITHYDSSIGEFTVKNGTGFVTDIYDIMEIRACIDDIINHREKLDEARSNIAKVKDDFNWKYVAQRLDIIYPVSPIN